MADEKESEVSKFLRNRRSELVNGIIDPSNLLLDKLLLEYRDSDFEYSFAIPSKVKTPLIRQEDGRLIYGWISRYKTDAFKIPAKVYFKDILVPTHQMNTNNSTHIGMKSCLFDYEYGMSVKDYTECIGSSILPSGAICGWFSPRTNTISLVSFEGDSIDLDVKNLVSIDEFIKNEQRKKTKEKLKDITNE